MYLIELVIIINRKNIVFLIDNLDTFLDNYIAQKVKNITQYMKNIA